MSAADMMVWGLVIHLVADWLLQNEWMAVNKMKRRLRVVERWHGDPLIHSDLPDDVPWWDRHPAAYVHAGIHGALLALVFGWVAAPLALAHLVIDCRWPVEKWSRLIRQTQPSATFPDVDVGLFVRFWNDQVWHVACIAVAALLVA